MTPAEEARFIQLWQQGASDRALAQALGCALAGSETTKETRSPSNVTLTAAARRT
jgi:hypothetical protein